MGTPPILTRSKLHEELLGEDWPFFVDGPDDLAWREDLSEKLDFSGETLKSAADLLQHHSIQYIAQRFEALIQSD